MRKTIAKPDISVIVTNYNHSQYIEEAVDSVLNQSKPEFEIIIVDDGSTDDSKEVIEKLIKLDPIRIQKPIYLEKNQGKWCALNTAIAQANGKIITLMDADDASCKHRLERQYQVMKDFGSYHNLCGFHHCHSPIDVAEYKQWTPATSGQLTLGYDVMPHDEVVKLVLQGRKTPGINHYYVGNNYEVHGASSMFYKQFWDHGIKFMPGNMGLRCQKAEDSSHNTSLTLLLQKTSVLKEPLYCYRRGTTTNPAYLEDL